MVHLGVEETLLRFRDCYGTENECSIKCYKRRNTLRFDIAQRGSHTDPLVYDDIELSNGILEKLGLKPRYSYNTRKAVNIVTVPVHLPPRKNALFIHLIVAVLLALLTGWIVNALPSGIRDNYIVASTVGYFLPAMNGYCLQLELLMTAWKSDMADKSILAGGSSTPC